MAVSFTCPACRSALGFDQALAAGQMVKCPACANVFTPNSSSAAVPVVELPASSWEDRDSYRVEGLSPNRPGDDHHPRDQRRRPDDDDPPRNRRRPRNDWDGDEDADDYLPGRPRRSSKKRNSALLLILLLGGLGAGLIVFLITGLVWPAFLLPNQGGNNRTIQPDQLPGTTWSGSETLKGYNKLTFVFGDNQQAIMIDKDGQTQGTFVIAGANITLMFHGDITYTGTLAGNTLSGTATNGKNRWNWNVRLK